MKPSRSVVAVALALGLTATLLWVLQRPSSAAPARIITPPSLIRRDDPVVVTGGLLSRLAGVPLNQVFVYAYQGATPAQIPFQIDERNANGTYVPFEDGQLDSNDELVFMAIDGGSRVDNPSLSADGTSISPAYMITITDPISNTRAWAYLFRSTILTHTLTADYVSYDRINDRISSAGLYALGFHATYGIRDYLTLGANSTDLLDRDKLRVNGTALGFIPFSITEENSTKDAVHALDGPVRVTRVNTSTLAISVLGTTITSTGTSALFAYRSLLAQPATISPPGSVSISSLRFSTDWNAQAAGMTYYDADNPTGVVVDGIPDTITTTPASRWTEVASLTGTVVTVLNIPAGLGGTQSTYYKDNSAIDPADTGDQRSYGDAGLQINNPNAGSYTLLARTYFLTGTTANVGAVYANYYDHPLQVSIAPVIRRIYLPLVRKG